MLKVDSYQKSMNDIIEIYLNKKFNSHFQRTEIDTIPIEFNPSFGYKLDLYVTGTLEITAVWCDANMIDGLIETVAGYEKVGWTFSGRYEISDAQGHLQKKDSIYLKS